MVIKCLVLHMPAKVLHLVLRYEIPQYQVRKVDIPQYRENGKSINSLHSNHQQRLSFTVSYTARANTVAIPYIKWP